MATRQELERAVRITQTLRAGQQVPRADLEFAVGIRQQVSAQPAQQPSLLGRVGRGALEAISRPAAATRAFVGALQQGEQPFGPAFRGLTTGEAPTGEQIAAQTGLSQVPSQERTVTGRFGQPIEIGGVSPAQVGGLLADITLDPINLLPGGLLRRAARPLARTRPIQAVTQATRKLTQAAKQKGLKAFAKVGNLSGIPEQDIINFVNRNKEVKKVIKEFGTSPESFADAAADFTETAQDAIKAQKKAFNDTVGQFFETAEVGNKKLKIQPVIDSLQEKIGRLDELVDVDDIAEIGDKIALLTNAADDVGEVTVKRLNAFRKRFGEEATNRAFPGVTPFRGGTNVQQAVADAGQVASDLLKKESPQLKKAFAGLADLRKFQARFIPKGAAGPKTGLFAPGGVSLPALTGATRGGVRGREALEELSRVTGQPFFQRAEDIATAQSFARPPLFAGQRATGGFLPGGSLSGVVLSGMLGASGQVPAAVATGLLSSPLFLKQALQAGLLGQRGLGTLPAITPALQAARVGGGLLTQ